MAHEAECRVRGSTGSGMFKKSRCTLRWARHPSLWFAAWVALTILLSVLACNSTSSQPSPSPSGSRETLKPTGPSAPAPITRPAIGFTSHQRLQDHYRKHGREFGPVSEKEYLRLAQELRDRSAGGEVLESRRADGVITRFDRKMGAFLAFNPDGTIRTFFRPNEGEAYFWRQSHRKKG